jgi:hypothetical protein
VKSKADSERECRSLDLGDLGLGIMMVIVYVGQPITAFNQSHLGTVKGADPRSELRDHHVGRRRLVLSPRLGNGKSCIHAEFNFMLEFVLSSFVGIFSMERNHLWLIHHITSLGSSGGFESSLQQTPSARDPLLSRIRLLPSSRASTLKVGVVILLRVVPWGMLSG